MTQRQREDLGLRQHLGDLGHDLQSKGDQTGSFDQSVALWKRRAGMVVALEHQSIGGGYCRTTQHVDEHLDRRLLEMA